MVVAHGERVREGLALRFRFRHVSVIWVAVYSFGRFAAVTVSCQVSWNASGSDSSFGEEQAWRLWRGPSPSDNVEYKLNFSLRSKLSVS